MYSSAEWHIDKKLYINHKNRKNIQGISLFKLGFQNQTKEDTENTSCHYKVTYVPEI